MKAMVDDVLFTVCPQPLPSPLVHHSWGHSQTNSIIELLQSVSNMFCSPNIRCTVKLIDHSSYSLHTTDSQVFNDRTRQLAWVHLCTMSSIIILVSWSYFDFMSNVLGLSLCTSIKFLRLQQPVNQVLMFLCSCDRWEAEIADVSAATGMARAEVRGQWPHQVTHALRCQPPRQGTRWQVSPVGLAWAHSQSLVYIALHWAVDGVFVRRRQVPVDIPQAVSPAAPGEMVCALEL